MEQKKAIVVGASSGIGQGLAAELVKHGYRVGITGRRKQNLLDIQKSDPKNYVVKCFDVQVTDDSLACYKALIEELGGLDLLIYSSGNGFENKDLVFDIELDTIKTNTVGFTNLVTYTFNYFKQQKKGQIAAITSIAGFRGNPDFPAYFATKAYLLNYIEGLRKKSIKEKLNIVITDLRAGFVKTGHVDPKKMIWATSVEVAAKQMYNAIRKKRKVAYILRRWRIIAGFLKIVPRFIYDRLPL
jgi:short-subunit dehydrogenase